MLDFKINFPTGYQISDEFNDNIDVNIVTSDNKVYFVTLFTCQNIQNIMKINKDIYFWADSMLILDDLKKVTIEEVIGRILLEGLEMNIFSFIGSLSDVYGKGKKYSDIAGMTF